MLAQIAKIAGLALAVYVALATALYLIQRKMMYFPALALPPAPPPFEAVVLQTHDGLDLVSWYAAAADGRHTVIYFQGNGGGIADRLFMVEPFLQAGYGLLLVGYRGYGGNPGTPSETGLLADGRAALAFAAARGIPAARLVLLGESLGSGVAVALAAERQVAGLILQAPFTSAVDVASRLYFWLPVRLLLKDRFDSLARIGDVRAPLLIVHGERDMTVPVDLGRRLLAAANEPKRGVFLPRAGHNDMVRHGLIEAELEFLAGL